MTKNTLVELIRHKKEIDEIDDLLPSPIKCHTDPTQLVALQCSVHCYEGTQKYPKTRKTCPTASL
jgi:hypothetical protein